MEQMIKKVAEIVRNRVLNEDTQTTQAATEITSAVKKWLLTEPYSGDPAIDRLIERHIRRRLEE